eukprot:13665578-Ditylum_brightwellii.AAC.1
MKKEQQNTYHHLRMTQLMKKILPRTRGDVIITKFLLLHHKGTSEQKYKEMNAKACDDSRKLRNPFFKE